MPSDHDIIHALTDDLPVGVWVARAPGGELVYTNQMFAEIMGIGGIHGVRVGGYSEPYGIFHRNGERYAESRMPFVRALEERTVVVIDDLCIHRPDGTRVDVRAFARPVLADDGTPTHVIIAFFDVTRETSADRARLEAEHRLHLAQRLEAIGTLAGGIAHDFNNLVFGIKLIASELAASESDPRRRAALELIDEVTDRASGLTKSLLGFARRGKHRAIPVSLVDLVGALGEILRRTISSLALELELDARHRGTVIGDHAQLEQVVMNLVVNARDALAERSDGRIVIRVRDGRAGTPPGALGVALAGDVVILEVSDDGPGIPPELRDRVFGPYFTTKMHGPDRGTGLGLATVFGIIETHNGAVELAAGLDGRGATIRVYLPAAIEAAELALPIEPARVAPTGTGAVLIVDDDSLVRRALVTALEQLGYTPIEADGGARAVELYRARRAEIRAVVLDVVMPGMSGRDTYIALRELDPDVAVLLMSGYAANEETQALIHLGARGFIAKPYAVDTLAGELARLARPS